MQSLGDIRALLAAHGLRPKHRFGQNFLHDARHLERIAAAADLHPGDLVLEVGPGTGALSERLLDAGARLVAVEIDRDLEPILRQRFAPYGERATLVMGDALAGKRELNPAVLAALAAAGGQGPAQETQETQETREASPAGALALGPRPVALPAFAFIANLPYNVASPLIANLAMDYPAMHLAVVMVQREVADRLAAGPGGKDYGPLGVLVQAMCAVEQVDRLPPGAFWPPPEVDSAVVRLRRRPQPLTADPHRLAATLHTLFSKRRKQLGAILGRGAALPPGVDPTWRPERLSVPQLIALSDLRD